MAQPLMAEVIHMTDRTPSPQVEDGYTKIANELLEAIAKFGFSSRQFSVLLAVMRKTYGFNKKTDDIGLSQIVKLTGIEKSNVSKTVRLLADMRVLLRSQGAFGHKLSINKHYSQWGVVISTTPDTVVKTTTPPVVKTTTPPVVKTTTTKDNPSKDNLSKEKNLLRNRDCASASFDAFWAIWPKKKDRKKALAAFVKINPDDALLQTILAAVAAQAATASWIDDGGEYIPHPTTWLNGARWEDEVKPVAGAFSADNQAFIDTFNDNIGDKALPVGEWSQKIADLIAVALAGKWGMDLERWGKFWCFVRDDCQFKGSVSFEWLMNHDNIVRIVRGEFQ